MKQWKRRSPDRDMARRHATYRMLKEMAKREDADDSFLQRGKQANGQVGMGDMGSSMRQDRDD